MIQQRAVAEDADSHPAVVLQTLLVLGQRLAVIEQKMDELQLLLSSQKVEKEWYTTAELAQALGKSHYTIQERWCNEGRIECQKDPDSGKWRIPGREYRRLVGGGPLKPKPR